MTMYALASILGPTLAGLFGGDDKPRQSFVGHGSISPDASMRAAQGVMTNLGNALGARAANGVSLPSAYAQQPGAYTGGGLPMPIGLVAQDPAVANPSLLSRPGMSGFADIFKGLENFGGGGGIVSGLNPGNGNPPSTVGGGSTTIGGVGPGEIPPINYQDPDGPLGGDYGLDPGAFDDFYQPGFDQRTTQNPNGTSDGAEPGEGDMNNGAPRNRAEAVGPRRRVYDPEGEAQLARASDLGDPNSGDDMSKGMGAVQLLLEAYGQRGV